MKTGTMSRIKAVILSLVIAIVLTSFVIYLIESIRPGPEYDDYCGSVRGPVAPKLNGQGVAVPETENECSINGGTWRNGYCDYYYVCQQEFDSAQDKHQLIVFILPAIKLILTNIIIIAIPISPGSPINRTLIFC